MIVNPKLLSFGNVLLYQKQKQILNLTNKTLVPLLWRISNLQNFSKDFNISIVEGILKYQQTETVTIEYVPTEVQVINKYPLKLEVIKFTDILVL